MSNTGLLSTVIINPDEICGRGRVCSVLGADVKQVTGVGLQLIQSVTMFPGGGGGDGFYVWES